MRCIKVVMAAPLVIVCWMGLFSHEIEVIINGIILYREIE